MGIYADLTDLSAYIVGLVIDDPAGLENTIADAERDLDRRVFVTKAYEVDDPATRKWDPATLTAIEADELKRATCAQVEYRLEQGPEFFVRAQRDRTSRRNVTLEGKLPLIGPKVWTELAGSDLVRPTTRTQGRRLSQAETFQNELD